MTVTCDLCGSVEDDATATLTWSTDVERGRPRRCCVTCTREHVRAMEAKLDPEHW